MNKITENINWLIQPTGDPFADTGGLVIEFLYQQPQLKDKSILELIEYAANIYVNKWGGKIHAFFLNSTITQAQFKGQRKIDETIKYYRSLIEETAEYQKGYCRMSGRETRLYSAGRDNHILSGSGTFVNFHHAFQSGLLLSKEMLIRMFFVPLGLIQLSDKIALVCSNNEAATKYFVFQNCKENLQALASNISEGVLRSIYTNPANALFGFADKCISDLDIILSEDEDAFVKEDVSLTLYHFTNFGAGPEVIIHELSALVFRFYAYCNGIKVKKDWSKFVRAHYRNSKFKDAVFNELTEVWESKKEDAGFESYQTWRNPIFELLLSGQSLRYYFLKWSITHSFPFIIVEIYQILLRNMEKRTVQKIKELADYIVSSPDADSINKTISRLHRMQWARDLREFLVSLNAKNYLKDGDKPLITIEDYVDYLFPDGMNWREIKDVLLIAVYQKLHELNVAVNVELPETTITQPDENE